MNLVFAYCIAAAQYFTATQKIKENYTMINNGKMIVNPYFKIQKDSLDQMMKIGALFGFSPVDRQKLTNTNKVPTEKDPFAGEL